MARIRENLHKRRDPEDNLQRMFESEIRKTKWRTKSTYWISNATFNGKVQFELKSAEIDNIIITTIAVMNFNQTVLRCSLASRTPIVVKAHVLNQTTIPNKVINTQINSHSFSLPFLKYVYTHTCPRVHLHNIREIRRCV